MFFNSNKCTEKKLSNTCSIQRSRVQTSVVFCIFTVKKVCIGGTRKFKSSLYKKDIIWYLKRSKDVVNRTEKAPLLAPVNTKRIFQRDPDERTLGYRFRLKIICWFSPIVLRLSTHDRIPNTPQCVAPIIPSRNLALFV